MPYIKKSFVGIVVVPCYKNQFLRSLTEVKHDKLSVRSYKPTKSSSSPFQEGINPGECLVQSGANLCFKRNKSCSEGKALNCFLSRAGLGPGILHYGS